MTYTTIPGLTNNINRPALAILALLEGAEIDIPDGGYCSLYTHAWYNGRERGISITVATRLKDNTLVITFGENRNSDSIFVDSWEMPFLLNPPSVDNFTEEAYENRKWFEYDKISEAAHFIQNMIQDRVSNQDVNHGQD